MGSKITFYAFVGNFYWKLFLTKTLSRVLKLALFVVKIWLTVLTGAKKVPGIRLNLLVSTIFVSSWKINQGKVKTRINSRSDLAV